MGGAANAIFDVMAAPPTRTSVQAPHDDGAFADLVDAAEPDARPHDKPQRAAKSKPASEDRPATDDTTLSTVAETPPTAPAPQQQPQQTQEQALPAQLLLQTLADTPPAPQQQPQAAPQATPQPIAPAPAPAPATPQTNAATQPQAPVTPPAAKPAADKAKSESVAPTTKSAPAQTPAQPTQQQTAPTQPAEQPAATPTPQTQQQATPVVTPAIVETALVTAPVIAPQTTEATPAQTTQSRETQALALDTTAPEKPARFTAPPQITAQLATDGGKAAATPNAGAAQPTQSVVRSAANATAESGAVDKPAAPAAPAPAQATAHAAATTHTQSTQQSSHEAVAAASRAAPTQVGREIVRRFNGENTRFEMRLDPPELGRVEVKLEVSRDNRVTAVIAAESPQALQELTRHARDLEQALQSAGLDLADNGLSFDLSDRGAMFAERDGASTNGVGALNASDATEEAPVRARPIGFESWRGARVDLVA